MAGAVGRSGQPEQPRVRPRDRRDNDAAARRGPLTATAARSTCACSPHRQTSTVVSPAEPPPLDKANTLVSPSAPMSSSAATKIQQQPWILGRVPDLLMFIAAPLWIVLAFVGLRQIVESRTLQFGV